MLGAHADGGGLVDISIFAVQEIHLGRADEAGDEQRLRVVVELHGRADLHDLAVLQNHDAIGQSHGFHLIVGDVDHGGIGERFLELGDLHAGRDAQGGVEVGKRLVEQEHLRVAHDGAADGDALSLAARERLGQAIEIGAELEHVGGSFDLLADFVLGRAGEF